MRKRMMRTLKGEGGLSVLLALMVIYVFILAPLVASVASLRYMLGIVLTLILVMANTALVGRRRLLTATMLLAVATFVFHWLLHFFDDSRSLAVATEVATIAFFGVTLIGILQRTLASGRITFHRVNGSVACYLMLAFMWSSAFGLIEEIQPGSFDLGQLSGGEKPPMLYFSLVTLTTLGYGDISPLKPPARMLSVLEALTGQLFLVVLVARMVALWTQRLPHTRDDES